MIRLKTAAVLLVLAVWAPASSHAVLEGAGLIHQQGGNSDADHDHDGADGLCVSATSHVQTPQPSLAMLIAPIAGLEFGLAASAVMDGSVLEASGPAPPGVAPPELSPTWHFSFRTSLPALRSFPDFIIPH